MTSAVLHVHPFYFSQAFVILQCHPRLHVSITEELQANVYNMEGRRIDRQPNFTKVLDLTLRTSSQSSVIN